MRRKAKLRKYLNINTATEEELLKHGLESEPHINGADVAKRLVAARPFTSWKDLAHREGFSWKHCSFLHGEHYRLHDVEYRSPKHEELLVEFHVVAQELLNVSIPINLKVLAVSSEHHRTRDFLGCIFDLESKDVHHVRATLSGPSRAIVTHDKINGGSLLICELPPMQPKQSIQTMNEIVGRRFDAHLPLLVQPLTQTRFGGDQLTAARMMKRISPERFLTNGVVVMSSSDTCELPGFGFAGSYPQDGINAELQSLRCDCCGGNLQTHLRKQVSWRAKYIFHHLEETYGVSLRNWLPWLFGKYRIPITVGMSGNTVGKQWGGTIDWRASVWSTLLHRTPHDTVSTFYSVTSPEVFEVLSMEQLSQATNLFRRILTEKKKAPLVNLFDSGIDEFEPCADESRLWMAKNVLLSNE